MDVLPWSAALVPLALTLAFYGVILVSIAWLFRTIREIKQTTDEANLRLMEIQRMLRNGHEALERESARRVRGARATPTPGGSEAIEPPGRHADR